MINLISAWILLSMVLKFIFDLIVNLLVRKEIKKSFTEREGDE